MKSGSKIAIVVVVFAVLFIVVVVGYSGIVRIPLITSSPQAAIGSTDITSLASVHFDVLARQYSDSNIELPPLSMLDSFGIHYSIYGTDASSSFIEGYYTDLLSNWEYWQGGSSTSWAFGLYRNNLYGFGYAVVSDYRLHQYTGYGTVYITMEGPLQSWNDLIQAIEGL